MVVADLRADTISISILTDFRWGADSGGLCVGFEVADGFAEQRRYLLLQCTHVLDDFSVHVAPGRFGSSADRRPILAVPA
jgi:hypothetical protein